MLEAKDVIIVSFDVVSITIGCIVIIWTVVLGIVGDSGVDIRVFSVVDTSVDVVLENSVESNEDSVDSILVVKMSPDVEDLTSKDVTVAIFAESVSVDLSVLMVMDEDADDS